MLQVQTEYVASPPATPPLHTFATPPLCAVSNVYIFSWGHFPLARTIKLILIDNFVALAARLVSSRRGESACTRLFADRRVCVVCVRVKQVVIKLHYAPITHNHTHSHTDALQ